MRKCFIHRTSLSVPEYYQWNFMTARTVNHSFVCVFPHIFHSVGYIVTYVCVSIYSRFLTYLFINVLVRAVYTKMVCVECIIHIYRNIENNWRDGMNIHVVMLTRAHFDNDTKLGEWVEFGGKEKHTMSSIIMRRFHKWRHFFRDFWTLPTPHQVYNSRKNLIKVLRKEIIRKQI